MSMDFGLLVDILVEFEAIEGKDAEFVRSLEAQARRELFRQHRDQFSGPAASPASIHPIEVLLSLEVLHAKGVHLNDEVLAQWIAAKAGLPFQHLDPLKVNLEVMTRHISRPYARKHGVIPLKVDQDVLTCAVVDPFDPLLFDQLQRSVGLRIEKVVAPKKEIDRILTEFYGLRSSVQKAEEKLEPLENLGNLEQLVKMKSERELEASDSHVIKAVEYLLHYAYDQRASDIHIEPKREHSLIRFRIDGVLHDIQTMTSRVHMAVVSRLKLLGRMDIAEKRKPQDGRIKTKLKEREVELRCSILPVAFGEKLVIRIFDPQVIFSDLAVLGMEPHLHQQFDRLIHEPNGMILVTGPTGSGKTTTLYSALKVVATSEVNITTIEDPVEMVVERFNQVTVNPLLDLSFSGALRTVLRQDPDIIMVGEIRDHETAVYAIQAALTGHLLFSTLHTNDAPSAVARLKDLGAEKFLISGTLLGVLAQRLLRRVCQHCKTTQVLTQAQLHTLGLRTKSGNPLNASKGKGCHHCRRTGMMGRVGVFELMAMDDVLKKAVAQDLDSIALKQLARQKGMQSMKESAVKKMLNGDTSFQEIMKVVLS